MGWDRFYCQILEHSTCGDNINQGCLAVISEFKAYHEVKEIVLLNDLCYSPLSLLHGECSELFNTSTNEGVACNDSSQPWNMLKDCRQTENVEK